MGRDYTLQLDWPMSSPVPIAAKPECARPVPGALVGHDTLRAALAAIPNDDADSLGYDEWRNIIFGIHFETDGDEIGLEIAREFSARSPKHDDAFFENRVWPYITVKDVPVTGRSILKLARDAGWIEDVTDEFEMVCIGLQVARHRRRYSCAGVYGRRLPG
jgi:hypothetical protein